QGEGYNEMRFEDAKGGEGLFMHAQKDMSTTVKDNQTTTVEKGNQTVTVEKGDRTVTSRPEMKPQILPKGA
ncbi:bacteriophage T4 gp5 trimerisation domain-containing protein, partial [Yersinia pestis]|nr:hypothetical protein [Yersinia pestis]MCF2952304.1 hypothetical protein [Yersinia pestis subsp. pestis]MCF2959972.1 hypothetical protein [Yersinia pestis subsp. pestis]MCV6860305.1 hypothetical protein [Yersinia pestis subsp. pestis]MCV6870448.1 hypothetical protein [Yersinia pestis subsp. pestis]